MTRNVAIVGKMYAGKTTLANQLVEAHGFRRVLMAGPLKEIACRAYGEEIQKDKLYDVTGLDGQAGQRSGREILQGIGQSIKSVDRDIWLKMFVNDTKNMMDIPLVVDDVRFGFEADYLRNHGWYIIKVQTPDSVRIQRAMKTSGTAPTPQELNHESEREVDSIRIQYTHLGDDPLDRLGLTAKNIVSLANM